MKRIIKFCLQIGAPIYESLEGPQLSTNWLGMVGWQWVF